MGRYTGGEVYEMRLRMVESVVVMEMGSVLGRWVWRLVVVLGDWRR